MFRYSNFKNIGYNNSETPAVYSYETTEDTIAQVSVSGYFSDPRSEIREGDLIVARCTDGSTILTALNSDSVSAMPSAADVSRVVESSPAAEAETIAAAVSLAEEGAILVGGNVNVINGAKYQLIDAGSSGARPAESELVNHVSGGSGGLYLSMTKGSFNPFVFQATSIGNCLMTGIAISASELNIYLDSDIYKEVTTVTFSAGSTLSIGTIAGPSTANTGKTAMLVNSRTTGKKIYLKMTGLSGLTANAVYEVRAEQVNTKITLS